jgi:hypothetical protein
MVEVKSLTRIEYVGTSCFSEEVEKPFDIAVDIEFIKKNSTRR